jgi:hypothetical protein
MKKLGLLSVATAVAIAGLGTSAFAKPAEEAIKGVDVSGYVRYRFTNDAGTENDGTGGQDAKSSSQGHEYKTVLTIKSKVNDSVTAKIKMAGANTVNDESGDADPVQANIKEANFIMSLGGNTVIAGKQGLPTPFADPADQQGTGVVAVVPMGGVTLAAGWFDNHDGVSMYKDTIDGTVSTYDLVDADGNSPTRDIKGNNITAIAALGAAGGINYAAWYAIVSENMVLDENNATAAASAGAAAMNINVNGTFGGIKVELNHASVAYSVDQTVKDVYGNNSALTPTQDRVVVSGDFGGITAAAAVVMTGDDGGDVTLGDTDASANFALEQASCSALAGATFTYVGVGTQAAGLNVNLDYVMGSGVGSFGGKTMNPTAKDVDVAEAKLSVAYPMSPNFKISGYYSTLTAEQGTYKDNNDEIRVELLYTF